MDCVHQGCKKPATIQWRKTLTEAELDSYIDALHEQAVRMAQAQKFDLRVRMSVLQTAHDNPPEHLSPEDVVRFQDRAKSQLAELQSSHDGIATTFNLDHHRPGSYKVQGHCEDHVHDDTFEWYSVLHDPACSDKKECGCS